jgi:hypothetical protein
MKTMGPTQLSHSIDSAINANAVELWKNIPMPVCEATTAIYQCLDNLKRFALTLDARLIQLGLKGEQQQVENKSTIVAVQRETIDTMNQIEYDTKDRIRSFTDQFELNIEEKLRTI